MLSMKFGYYHTDPVICWEMDSALDTIYDVTTNFYQKIYLEKNEVEKEKNTKIYFTENLKLWCEKT